ncbi:uncharacterized protein LOC115376875 isoform X1 [Myripristis murdjan]|uniref:uncharacterized protein LOC115376875 isoform X1 n=1 Tax=Myripristis murdjan TaxID=586833 RepID=UPI0011762BE5|nr:uncharacterized protein LOC115376875 isoform X1 [Myripristis murdjan]
MIKPALLFGCLFLLFSLSPCEGQSQLIGPPQPIVAIVGDDIILPSHLDPAVDTFDMIVEWTRPNLDHRLVLQWRHGWELEHKKHPSYEGRTSLSLGKLTNGDVSLKLSEVKLSDEGKYRCYILSLERESIVELVVGQTEKNVRVFAWAGENVVLPCEIPPTEDISVEWSKEGLKPEVVYLYRDSCETHEMKNPAYVFRTHLFMTEMKNGNISLMISNVQPSDTGIYRCRIVSTQQIIKTVHLTVGEASQSEISITSDGETLQYEVCWLPKPEVEWLNDQGKVIKGTHSTETLRNPDVNQCYTVTSTVKVQSSDSSRKLTARIRQPQINNIMKINFQLPDKSTGYLVGIIVSSILSLAVGVGVGIFVTKKMPKEAERSHTPIPATSRRSSSDSAASTEDNLLLLDSKKRLKQPAEPKSQPRVEANDQMQNQQLNRQQSVVTEAPNSVPHISGNGNTSSSPQSPTNCSPHTGMFANDSNAKPSLSPFRNQPCFIESSQSEGPKYRQDGGLPPRSPSHGFIPSHIGSPKRSTPDLSKAAAGSTTSLFNNPLAQKSSFHVRSKSCYLPVCGP